MTLASHLQPQDEAGRLALIEYFTPEQLRDFVKTRDWDADFVEAVIKKQQEKAP